MSTNEHIGARLREERDRVAMSQADLSEAIGVVRRTQGVYEKGERMPDADYLAKAWRLGLDVHYVITGERRTDALKSGAEFADSDQSSRKTAAAPSGHHLAQDAVPGGSGGPHNKLSTYATTLLPLDPVVWRSDAGASLVLPVLFAPSNIRREFQVIPKMNAEASAGHGLGNADQARLEAAGVMALDRRWMFDNFGRAGEGFATVQVAGDSMEPTLFNGETIVIDTTVDRIDVSGIYVIKAGRNVLVKRVQLKFDGTLILKSDNNAYEPETLSPVEAQAVKVQGRMVWPRVR